MLTPLVSVPKPQESRLVKDRILDQLAESANVAQFVSFSADPEPRQRYCRILGYPPNHRFRSAREAVTALLEKSPEGRVNIRTYHPSSPRGRAFRIGVADLEQAVAEVQGFARGGLYTIVNETVDVHDGGVSGVAESEVVEFAPGATPRGVDQPETRVLALPREVAIEILSCVYHFRPALDFGREHRVEFSVHPLARGYRQEHTILWERARTDARLASPLARWPNDFSRLLGDKAFGLLLADTLGFLVPATTVIPRSLAPFAFGRSTGSAEFWLRTCPREPVPGAFTTCRGWSDPYELLSREDPSRTSIASVLAQEGVPAQFSGALATTAEGEVTIQGVPGFGDRFMQGQEAPRPLPREVGTAVRELQDRLYALLGPVTVEWAYDGAVAWVLQLRREASESSGQIVYPGEPSRWRRFPVERGLEALRDLVHQARATREGIVLVGNVGLTSHMGETLRRAKVPSRIEAV